GCPYSGRNTAGHPVIGEDTMTFSTKRDTWRDMGPLAAIAAASAAIWFLGVPAAAQQQPRALPTFAVDLSWPKVPDRYKLGEISSIASAAPDNAYVDRKSVV